MGTDGFERDRRPARGPPDGALPNAGSPRSGAYAEQLAAAGAPSGRDPPTVSVVVAVLNEAETLTAQLEALATQEYRGSWEVVIADNGCTDGSMAIAARFAERFPALTVIDASTQRGDGYAKNRAVEAARGDIVVSCDADDVVEPRWIEALVHALRRCDIAGGTADREVLNTALVNRWYTPPTRRIARLSSPPPEKPGVAGGNIGAWKGVWDSLGGWDEGLISADSDFVVRAHDAGYRVGFAPGARVLARRRARLRDAARQAFARGVGAAQMRSRHPTRPPRSLDGSQTFRRVAFLLFAWPAALVAPGVRGYWLRQAAFLAGVVSTWRPGRSRPGGGP